jgi:methylase of polypeptide subunit release factors
MRRRLLRALSTRIVVTEENPLLDLLNELKARHYHFAAVTPSTHSRVTARPLASDPGLRDIFGWNRPFRPNQIEPDLLALLQRSACLEAVNGRLKSLVRVASLEDQLFLHSAFPTNGADDVFFGPDTYRFATFVNSQLPAIPSPEWIVDMGAGSGAGGVAAAKCVPAARLSLVDINPVAAQFARINCASAGVEAEVEVSATLPMDCDLVIANPPYMADGAHRTYRDGGGLYGGELACQWVQQAMSALRPAGTLLLYTGAAVVEGEVPLLQRIRSICGAAEAELRVYEIDPDVFGEELEKPEYQDVERICLLGIRITR